MPSRERAQLRKDKAASNSQQVTTLLRLREMLLGGEFKPGERMAELPIAALLGVSRTPLRLAMTTLQHEGLLDLHPTRGFVVRSFNRADVVAGIEIRGLLEGMAARKAAERVPANHLEALAFLQPLFACLEAMDSAVAGLEEEPASSFQMYIEKNSEFHTVLLRMADSRVLTAEMGRVLALPFGAPSSAFVRTQADIPESRNILRIGQDQHHAIVEALSEKDSCRAEGLLREHSRLAGRNLEIAFRHQATRDMMPGLGMIWEGR